MRIGGIGAALLVGLASVAFADDRGAYVGVAGGAYVPQNADTTGPGVDTSIEFDTGWAALGNVGYGFDSGFRIETEIGYRRNSVDEIGGAGGQGTASAWSFMGNLLYDYRNRSPLTPYVGVGAGAARVNFDNVQPVGGGVIDDHDTAFAYQVGGGFSFAVTDNFALIVDYRYFATIDPAFRTSSGIDVDSVYRRHTVLFGLRWSLGSPKPPTAQPAPAPSPEPAIQQPPGPSPAATAAPAPAPAPLTRNFLVFFDFDKADIRPDARLVIEQAAANVEKALVTRIALTGHADRAGPEGYNMNLSLRRANAVKAELMGFGIPANEIAVIGRGETQPLVPTPDGVREPRNRRVEIVF